MPAGRPLKIKTPEEMDALVSDYQRVCAESKRPISLSGLILHLGLSSYESLHRYEQRKAFAGAVRRARMVVRMAYEERLSGNSPTGAIFALKNMGWSDKQEHEHTGAAGGPIIHQVERKIVRPDDPNG